MADETALTKRIRFDNRNNMIVGFCMEHMCSTNVQFNDESDLHLLYDKLYRDEIHMASEVMVIATSSMAEKGYRALPIAALPCCKKENDWNLQARIFKGVLERYEKHMEPKTGPIFVLSTDGDSRRRKAYHNICSDFELETGYPELFNKLKGLRNFDLHCGEKGLCYTIDVKHIFKRIRGWIINNETLPNYFARAPATLVQLRQLLEFVFVIIGICR
jgi:hypothetical protein